MPGEIVFAPPAGLWGGARSLASGVAFIAKRPDTWPLALAPMAAATALIGALSALGLWSVLRATEALRAAPDVWRQAGGWIASLTLGLAAVLTAVLVGVSLAQPLTGAALDALSRRQETELGGPHRPDGSFAETAWRSLRVTLAALAVTLPVLGLLTVASIAFPPAAVVTTPLKFIVSALMLAWDLFDYPFGLRGMRVRERFQWIRENFRVVLGFGLASAAVFLVPGFGLVALPVGVVAATRIMVLREQAAPRA